MARPFWADRKVIVTYLQLVKSTVKMQNNVFERQHNMSNFQADGFWQQKTTLSAPSVS